MSKVLVLGGTRFFGKKLVNLLIQEGSDVTVATRGHTEDSFGDQVTRIHLDRTVPEQLRQAVGDTEWDVVYDNIGYHPQDAFHACEIFAGKVKRYIFTSTLSVYPFGQIGYSKRNSPHIHTPFQPIFRRKSHMAKASGLLKPSCSSMLPSPYVPSGFQSCLAWMTIRSGFISTSSMYNRGFLSDFRIHKPR